MTEEKQDIIKEWGEVYQPTPTFEGERVEFNDIIDKKLVIKDVAVFNGDYGEFLVVSAEIDSKMIQFPTGSSVIMPKLKKAKEEKKFPIKATIVEKKGEKTKRKYYDLK